MSDPARGEFQEAPGVRLATLVFAGTALALVAPLYGYLLVLRSLPPAVLAAAPGVSTRALPLAAGAIWTLSRWLRQRRSPRWKSLALPTLLGLLACLTLAQLPGAPVRLPFVSPLAGLRIHRLYLRAGRLSDLLPVLATAVLVSIAIAAVPAALCRRRGRSRIAAVAHGSARWATAPDVRAAGLLVPPHRGIHLGYLDPARSRPLTDPSDHHILTFAPPGIGKTTALVVPTLLRYGASAWVLDPKGELWQATAGWRARHLDHRCIRFAPTVAGTPRWNPLLTIPQGPGDVATAAVLARNLVVAPASAGDSHWTLSARSLCALLALHVRYAQNVPSTMAAVRTVLSSETDHDQLFDKLASANHDENGRYSWRDPRTGESTRTHPEVALLARRFRATPGRERGSIISTLQAYLDPWGDPQICAATETSDFALELLLDSTPTTVYLSIPFHDLGRLAPLVRLQLAALGRQLTERPPESPHRLEVIVDELASLGRLPIMEDLLAFLRGYNARCFLLLQDLSQLHRLYGLRETITGNCRVHLLTANQNPATRRHASTLAGAATARYRRTSHGHHGGALGRRQRTVAMTENARPLITEGEIGTLPLDQALAFKAGSPPIRAYLRPYFRDPELLRRSQVPPPDPAAAVADLSANPRNDPAG